MKRVVTLTIVALLAACAEPKPEAPRPEPAQAEGTQEAGRSESAHPVHEAPVEEEPASAAGSQGFLPAEPDSGCVFGEPVRVVSGDGWASITADERAFFVAGSAVDGQRERVFVARVEFDGSVRMLSDTPFERPVPTGHRRAAPAVEVSRGTLGLAIVDAERRVLLAELSLRGGELGWTTVGRDGSLRFSPALAPVSGGWTLAWTVEKDESFRVRTATKSVEGVSDSIELRAPGGAAAAPTFVVGASEPVLVFLDPRAGLSVAHRVTGRDFTDLAVARPLNLVAEPPEIVVVRAGDAEWIAYTAVGSAATTAVGLARLDDVAPPSPLVPGSGYGILHVDGAGSIGDGAVFVADAPQSSPPGSPRELHVRILSPEGSLGTPTVLHGPSGQASRGRIAHARDGVVAVSFTEPTGVHVVVGRCAPAPG